MQAISCALLRIIMNMAYQCLRKCMSSSLSIRVQAVSSSYLIVSEHGLWCKSIPPHYGMRNLLLLLPPQFCASQYLTFHSSKDSHSVVVFFSFPVIFLTLNNCLDSFYRSIKFLNEWLQSMDYDINFLWHNITVSFSKVICNILTV